MKGKFPSIQRRLQWEKDNRYMDKDKYNRVCVFVEAGILGEDCPRPGYWHYTLLAPHKIEELSEDFQEEYRRLGELRV